MTRHCVAFAGDSPLCNRMELPDVHVCRDYEESQTSWNRSPAHYPARCCKVSLWKVSF